MIPRYTPSDFAALWSPSAASKCGSTSSSRVRGDGGRRARGRAARRRHSRQGDRARSGAHRRNRADDEADVIAFLTHVEEKQAKRRDGSPRNDVERRARFFAGRAASRRDRQLIARPIASSRRSPRARASMRRRRCRQGATASSRAGHVRPRARGHYASERSRSGSSSRVTRSPSARSQGGRDVCAPHAAIEAAALAKLARARDGEHADRGARPARGAVLGDGDRAAAIERLATNVRHWQRSDVAEAEEAFTSARKVERDAAQAKPDRERKPLRLARIVRAAVAPALEDIVLWHEPTSRIRRSSG